MILEGVTAIKTGGHFDGSLVLHWERKLFIADSLLTVQVSSLRLYCFPGSLLSFADCFWVIVVGVLPCRSSAGYNVLCVHVVDPELHPAAAAEGHADLEGGQAV